MIRTLIFMLASTLCFAEDYYKADPAKFAGSAAERATLLNELYAALHRRLQIFTSLPFASLDRMALKARVDELADPHAMAR